MSMSNLWKKLSQSKKYREHFVAAQVKQAIPYQIRALLKARNWSQEELAQSAGLTQGAVSRAANPKYGNLSLNTLVRIAAGFDVAFIGHFVPFSELDHWINHLSEETHKIVSFEEERGIKEREQDLAEARERVFRAIQERAVPNEAVYLSLVIPQGQVKFNFGSCQVSDVASERRGLLVLVKTGAVRSSVNPRIETASHTAQFAQGA